MKRGRSVVASGGIVLRVHASVGVWWELCSVGCWFKKLQAQMIKPADDHHLTLACPPGPSIADRTATDHQLISRPSDGCASGPYLCGFCAFTRTTT